MAPLRTLKERPAVPEEASTSITVASAAEGSDDKGGGGDSAPTDDEGSSDDKDTASMIQVNDVGEGQRRSRRLFRVGARYGASKRRVRPHRTLSIAITLILH